MTKKWIWTRIDQRNRIARIKHYFHMFGDMCAVRPAPKNIDLKALKQAQGTIFDANMISIPAETCKYLAEHLDFLDERCKLLAQRIKELEKIS